MILFPIQSFKNSMTENLVGLSESARSTAGIKGIDSQNGWKIYFLTKWRTQTLPFTN